MQGLDVAPTVLDLLGTDGGPIAEVDFFGETSGRKLKRSADVKPGLFWHVWAEFFPHTDINRIVKGEKHSETTE